MQYVLTRFKIKRTKIQKTKSFLKKLNRRQEEIIAALKVSGIVLDCSFIEGRNLYIFKELKSLHRLKKKIKTSTLPIFNDIRAWAKECLTSRKDIKAIAIFASPKRSLF